MKKKNNMLILFGGGKAEHEVSRISADYLNTVIGNVQELNPILVEINKDGVWVNSEMDKFVNEKLLPEMKKIYSKLILKLSILIFFPFNRVLS